MDDGPGEWRFSTDDLPASERLPYLREVLGGSGGGLELSPVGERPLKWAVHAYLFDGLSVIMGETSGNVAHRTRRLLSDGNDDLVLTVNRSGYSLNSQVGRECGLGAGSAVLLSNAELGGQEFPAPATVLGLRIPRRRLAGLVASPEDALIRPIPANAAPLGLLVDYVETGLRPNRLKSPQLRHLFATHVHDLVALTIGASRDSAEIARGRGLAAATLNAAKRDIGRGLDGEEVSIVSVAGRLGVTPRYLQMLFEAEGTTFTEYVVAQRLARAHRMLSDPRFLDHSVTTIAFEVGFGHLSYFNRVFRRAYSATPSEVRASARAAMAMGA
jgi:AraC-like DNA-binding protein